MSNTYLAVLNAADIMQRKVVVVGPNDSLHDAMLLITEQHVTGLPVLDAKDRCIGVIAASDILTFVDENADSANDSSANMGRHFNPDQYRWEEIGLSAFGADDYGDTRVSELMARDLIAVAPDAPVNEVAQLMENKNVHRVLVLDDEQKLHGIISSFDFVRMVAAMEAS